MTDREAWRPGSLCKESNITEGLNKQQDNHSESIQKPLNLLKRLAAVLTEKLRDAPSKDRLCVGCETVLEEREKSGKADSERPFLRQTCSIHFLPAEPEKNSEYRLKKLLERLNK